MFCYLDAVCVKTSGNVQNGRTPSGCVNWQYRVVKAWLPGNAGCFNQIRYVICCLDYKISVVFLAHAWKILSAVQLRSLFKFSRCGFLAVGL